jgi:hypothetical protein
MGADAEISWWVIDEFVGTGLEAILGRFIPQRIDVVWPFANPRYVGVDLSWKEWLSLPETS